VARVVADDGRDVPYEPGRTDHGIVGAVLATALLPPLLSLGWVPLPPEFADPAAHPDEQRPTG